MAKSRRNRIRDFRADPIAKAVKPPTDPELVALRESKVLPVLRDLQKPDSKSRTTAAGAIANIVQDAKCRKLLLREQIVPIVMIETLTDSSIESRAAGWEILKVLAQEEEVDFCVHLYRLDILTALEHAAKSIVETITASQPPFAKLLKAQQNVVWEITFSLVSLIGALAVSRDEILEAITKSESVVKFLFRLVVTETCPNNVLEETLSCLISLSEDNLPLGQLITDDQETQCYEVLKKFASGSGIKAALACGVLHNVFSTLQWVDHSPGKDGVSDAVLIPNLARILEQTSLSNDKQANGHQGAGSAETAQVILEILASIATDLQDALEKGSQASKKALLEGEWNGFDGENKKGAADQDEDAMDVDADGSDGEGDDAEDNDEDDAEEDAGDDESDLGDLEMDMETVTGADDQNGDESAIDDLPTLRELLQKAVPQVIRMFQESLDSQGGEVLTIQSNALGTLNNLSWTVSCIDFADSENENIFRVWAPVGKKIWSKVVAPMIESDNADLGLATLVTSLAWAVSRSLDGSTPLKGDEHRKFISLYQATKGLTQSDEKMEDSFQSPTVKCIGVLGSLARDPAPLDRNREVGVFLMMVITAPETSTADKIEAFSQIFDIYGDETLACDKEVFWRDGFLKHLEESLPQMRTLAKRINKKENEELRTKADEVVLNLGRFLKYKKEHAPRAD